MKISNRENSEPIAHHGAARRQLLTTLVLLQVVIAVLLEEFQQARSQSESATWTRRLEQRTSLQPLLRDLAAAFEGPDDLRARLRAAFAAVCAAAAASPDPDDWAADAAAGAGWTLGRAGLQAGLAGLGYVPAMRFSDKEWREMVEGRGLCDARGRVGWEGFETLVREALSAYQVRVGPAAPGADRGDMERVR
jgi:hypothetical protein